MTWIFYSLSLDSGKKKTKKTQKTHTKRRGSRSNAIGTNSIASAFLEERTIKAQKTVACELAKGQRFTTEGSTWMAWGRGSRQESCLQCSALTLNLRQTSKLSESWFSYPGRQMLPSFISITELVFTHPFDKYLLNTSSISGTLPATGHTSQLTGAQPRSSPS